MIAPQVNGLEALNNQIKYIHSIEQYIAYSSDVCSIGFAMIYSGLAMAERIIDNITNLNSKILLQIITIRDGFLSDS